jgi:hypothetical protein
VRNKPERMRSLMIRSPQFSRRSRPSIRLIKRKERGHGVTEQRRARGKPRVLRRPLFNFTLSTRVISRHLGISHAIPAHFGTAGRDLVVLSGLLAIVAAVEITTALCRRGADNDIRVNLIKRTA